MLKYNYKNENTDLSSCLDITDYLVAANINNNNNNRT